MPSDAAVPALPIREWMEVGGRRAEPRTSDRRPLTADLRSPIAARETSEVAGLTFAADTDAAPKPQRDSSPRIRTAVAVFVSRFPRIDEPSILREINELERQGQPIILVPLLRDHGKVVHEEAKPWLRRALYLPLFSLAIVLSNLRRAVRQPRRYVSILGRLIAATIGHPTVLLKSLALFPKSVHLADVLPKRGVRHIHAQFATNPTTMAWIVSSLSNITYSFTVHGPDVFVHRLMLREKIARAKFVRAVSLFTKAFIAGLYSSVAEEKIEVIHIGVDPAMYRRREGEAVRTYALRPRILSVAALNATKGFSFTVDALSRLSKQGIDADFTIVGQGPRASRIRSAIHRFGLEDSVTMLGVLPQHEVARLMQQSDIFILPSVIATDGQMDGLPVALMEAMAAGKPVVASDIAGIPELVLNGRTGITVDMTHPERVADALKALIEDPARRDELGRAARERVERDFDIRATTRQLIELFDRHETRYQPARRFLAAVRWGDLGVIGLGMRRVHERQSSVLAEVTLTDGVHKRDAVVKRRRPTAPAASADEFAVITAVRKTLDDATSTQRVRCTVPRVLLHDRQHAAVIMEAPKGRALDLLVRYARVNRNGSRRLITPLRRAGGWLRILQERTRADVDGRHILTALVLLALRDLDLVTAAERQVRKRRDEIAAALRELETRASQQALPVVAHHGDFAARNVYIGDHRVEVIDFESFREGLPLEDVAHFLLTLRFSFAYPLLRHRYPRMAEAFMKGYGGKADGDLLQLFLMTRALHILAGGGARATGTWRDYFRRAVLREAIFAGCDWVRTARPRQPHEPPTADLAHGERID